MHRFALVAAALLVASAAYAKGNYVKGAKCTACHEGSPTSKKYNKATEDMMKKYKVEACKDCHGAAEGAKAMTTFKKK